MLLIAGNSPVSTSPYLNLPGLSQSFGGVLFGFAIPMFAAFVANSIGGKLAFPAGFIGGLMSTQPTQLLNFDPSTMQWATSFAGAVHLHWCADYFYRRGLPCEVDEPENPVTGISC